MFGQRKGSFQQLGSDDVPHLLRGMAELATGHTGTQTVIADTDRVVLEGIGKVIVTLGHGTHEDTDTLLGAEGLDVVAGPDDWSLETQGHFTAVGRQVIGDGVFDDLKELLLGVGGADGQTVQKLHHQASKTLEGTGNADRGVDFDQDPFGGMDEDLELASLVHRGVEQGKQTLMGHMR